MMGPIVVSANQAWNLINFRKGLIAALLERGHAVVAAAGVTNAQDEAAAQALAAMGCSVHPIPLDSMGMHPAQDLRTLFAYTALMRRLRPAAYLGWTIKPNVYGVIAARMCGVPTFPNISGLGTALIRPGPMAALARGLYRISLGGARAVLFQNADDRREFVERGLVRAERTHLISGSGVDTDWFAPPVEARAYTGSFLMIARLIGDKGVREYVEAARLLRQRDPRLCFRLLGPAEVDNRTAISRAELEGWIAEGVVEWHPPLADVRPAIAQAACVVLPSYREGTSRVLLEAAAMARPLVATDVPGCREVVREGVNGHLCSVQDPRSLAEAMWRVHTAPADVRAAMGLAGRQLVLDTFSQERVIATYLALLANEGVALPAKP